MDDITEELREEAARLGDDDGFLLLRAAGAIEALRDALVEYGDRSKMSPMMRETVEACAPAARQRRAKIYAEILAAAGLPAES